MVRRFAAFSVLLSLAVPGLIAQGLNVPTGVTKDDWEEINFEYNSSILVDGFPSLLRLAELLQKNPGYKVRVEGHTDIIGNNRSNERLGLARANAVRDFLVKYGAQANQITTSSDGKQNPRYPGQKPNYSRTDEARYMNRRVSLTVTDAQGNQVSAGGVGEAIRAVEAPKPAQAAAPDCCNEILKRLDRLDEIAKMLRDLADANADLRKQVADLRGAQDTLRQNQQNLQNQVASAPKPPSTTDIATEVQKTIEANKLPRFQLLGVNVGADDAGHTTFSGRGRYFAPFNERFAFESQAEYLYFKTQREGQFDLGLVDRMGPAQVGLFASFKHVDLTQYQNGGTLGQAALTIDYIFSRGKVGFFGTKGFMNSGVVNDVNARDPVSGALLNSVRLQTYLDVVDQAGLATTVGLFGNSYLEGNAGYLHSVANGNRFGFTSRFIIPLNSKIAFTVEGGLNETLLAGSNSGRAVVGLQFGNMLRPKEFSAAKHPVPVDVPRIRYEEVTRRVRTGNTPPVADAGPPQVNVPAGTITLDGSGSYDPDGDPITYQWVQQAGPVVTLSAPTSAKTTFTAISGAFYVFQLTVTDTYGAKGTARTTVSTSTSQPVQIVFFTPNPATISSGQSSTLSWKVLNADTVTLSGIGQVQATASTQVAPTATTTYTLSAKNSTSQDTATAVVVVNAAAPKLLYCYANPTSISAGGSATLNWATSNATNVMIQPGIGSVALSGSTSVSPSQTTTYTVTATGAAGTTSDTCNIVVAISSGGGGGNLPIIARFTAVPPTINSGQSSTLMWVVQNATTVSITTLGTVSLSGSQDVSPTTTTTYTLTATNSSGSTQATATVTVNSGGSGGGAVTITSFTANPPSSSSPGSKVTLTCTATGATTLTVAGVFFLGSSVSYPVFPTATTTYTCIAANQAGQTASAMVTVPVSTGGGGTGGPGPTVVVSGGLSQTTIYRQLTLDATASTSPNLPLTFQWVPASGTPIAISGANTPTPTIQLGNQNGEYDLNLTVTDSKGNSTTVTVRIYLLATHVQ